MAVPVPIGQGFGPYWEGTGIATIIYFLVINSHYSTRLTYMFWSGFLLLTKIETKLSMRKLSQHSG